VTQVIYAFDTTLPQKLAFCMRNLLPQPDAEPVVVQHDITHLWDELPPSTPTDKWIREAAKKDWIVVTCMAASARKRVQAAMAEAGVRVVYLAAGFSSLTPFPQAAKLCGCWDRIVAASYRLKRGEAIAMSMNGVPERL